MTAACIHAEPLQPRIQRLGPAWQTLGSRHQALQAIPSSELEPTTQERRLGFVGELALFPSGRIWNRMLATPASASLCRSTVHPPITILEYLIFQTKRFHPRPNQLWIGGWGRLQMMKQLLRVLRVRTPCHIT